MPENLFAACRINRNRGELSPKRVQLDGTIQDEVEGIFIQQRSSFLEGIDEEIPFDGRWKPDPNQLLTIEVPPGASLFRNTLDQDAINVPDLDVANFTNEGVRALFTGEALGGDMRVLVQNFHIGQVLSRKFLLFQSGNVFRRLSRPAFVLDTSLAFVIEGGLIKFKSPQKLRSVIDITDIYRAATEPEVRAFAVHQHFAVDDIEQLVESADEPARKLIHAISNSGVLGFAPTQIQQAAQLTQLTITMQGGKIVLPSTRRELKEVLQFLDESRYSGPLTGTPYVTNSRRPA